MDGIQRRYLIINLPLLLIVIGLGSLSLPESQVAWAEGAHVAHLSLATLYRLHNDKKVNSKKKPKKAKKPKVIAPPNNKKPARIHVSRLSFPCSDKLNQHGVMLPNTHIIARDWLVGNFAFSPNWYFRGNSNRKVNAGHLLFTYATDTYASSKIKKLFKYMEVLSFLLITPSILLLGYQIMLGASTFRYAGALEGFSRVVLGVLAVVVSFALVQMLISVENCISTGLVTLHGEYPYPVDKVNGIPILYMLPHQPPISYAGIVVPMTRWGCSINNFIGVFSVSFIVNTLGSVIPFFVHFAHLAGTVKTPHQLIQEFAQMTQTVLSILLWGQVFIRIILLNYYILTAPLAFACWPLPGRIGQNVVRLWCKGFLTVLFMQAVQVFILTTLPLVLPPLPQPDVDRAGIWQALLLAFPPILTLYVTLMVPRLLGASLGKALGTAGAVAGGVGISIGTVAAWRE